MLRKEKIIILGGRSGSSLVQKCLLSTNRFKNWGEKNSEAPFRYLVFNFFPNIPDKYYIDDFDLAKNPEFDFVINKIIEKYQPKFIVLERSLIQRLNSHVKLKWHKGELQLVKSNQKLYRMVGNYKNPVIFDYYWWKFHDENREKLLRNYDKEKILRIDFEDLINNFESTMRLIANFCNIRPEIELWNKIRMKKQVGTKTNLIRLYSKKKKKIRTMQDILKVIIQKLIFKILYVHFLSIIDKIGIINIMRYRMKLFFNKFFELFDYD